MSEVSISLDFTDAIERFSKELMATRNQIRVATNRSAEKVAKWFRTQVKKDLQRALGGDGVITQAAIGKRINLAKGRAAEPYLAVVDINLMPLPARFFNNLQQDKSRGGGTRVGREYFKGAFIAKLKPANKRPGVYRRKDHRRHPVLSMHIPIYGIVIDLIPAYEKGMAVEFERIFDHELQVAMGAIGTDKGAVK